jgi:hypothetical protein
MTNASLIELADQDLVELLPSLRERWVTTHPRFTTAEARLNDARDALKIAKATPENLTPAGYVQRVRRALLAVVEASAGLADERADLEREFDGTR